MSEDIDGIFEINLQAGTVHDDNIERTSYLAKACFCLGLLLVSMAIISSLISHFVIYNPPLTALNGLLLWFILIFSPSSVLLGIVALIRILLSRKKRRGYGLLVTGIVISAGAFVLAFYYWLINLSWA